MMTHDFQVYLLLLNKEMKILLILDADKEDYENAYTRRF